MPVPHCTASQPPSRERAPPRAQANPVGEPSSRTITAYRTVLVSRQCEMCWSRRPDPDGNERRAFETARHLPCKNFKDDSEEGFDVVPAREADLGMTGRCLLCVQVIRLR